MLVAELMDRDPVKVPSTTTFRDAAELFVRNHTSDLIVVDDGEYAGVVSEGDVLRALLPDYEQMTTLYEMPSLSEATALFLDSASYHGDRQVASVMVSQPIVLAPGDTLLKAATVMTAEHIRRMPVVEDGRVVGMLSRADVSRAVLAGAGD